MSALRYNEDKPRVDYILLFPNALAALARVMEFGASKYEDGNWQKGEKPDREYLGSCMRHLLKRFGKDQAYDDDSGCSHIAMAAWNLLALLELNHSDEIVDEELFKDQCEFWAKKKTEKEDDNSTQSQINELCKASTERLKTAVERNRHVTHPEERPRNKQHNADFAGASRLEDVVARNRALTHGDMSESLYEDIREAGIRGREAGEKFRDEPRNICTCGNTEKSEEIYADLKPGTGIKFTLGDDAKLESFKELERKATRSVEFSIKGAPALDILDRLGAAPGANFEITAMERSATTMNDITMRHTIDVGAGIEGGLQ